PGGTPATGAIRGPFDHGHVWEETLERGQAYCIVRALQAASAPERRWYPNRSPCSKTSGVLERPTRRRISNAPRLRTLMQPEAEGCGPSESAICRFHTVSLIGTTPNTQNQ